MNTTSKKVHDTVVVAKIDGHRVQLYGPFDDDAMIKAHMQMGLRDGIETAAIDITAKFERHGILVPFEGSFVSACHCCETPSPKLGRADGSMVYCDGCGEVLRTKDEVLAEAKKALAATSAPHVERATLELLIAFAEVA